MSKPTLLERLAEWIGSRAWPRLIVSGKGDDHSPISNTEKAVVFVVAYVIAFGLWLMVNLDREFSFTLELPLNTDTIARNQALVTPIPETVTVGFSGEGWKLLNLYNNPPSIPVNLESTQINLFEQIRTVFQSNQDVNITSVQPSILNVNLEERLEKRIPIDLRTELDFRRQFAIVGEVQIIPDSVTISGARSRVENINVWPSELVKREGLRESLDIMVPLEKPSPVVSISEHEVQMVARVSEFTEGELRIPIDSRGTPRGRDIRFNPASVAVRYSVPIEEYMDSQEIAPFEVYVPYSQITSDTTGLVSPIVELTSTDLNIRLRNFLPRTVSYFIVITD